MPALIDNLSDPKKALALQIINNLDTITPQITQYSNSIDAFKKSLLSAKTNEEFHKIVEQVIFEGKEVYKIYVDATKGMDNEVQLAIDEKINNDERLKATMEALHFNNTLSDSIIKTKERLSENELLAKLPHDKKLTAESFILSIKALKPIASILKSQKEVLQKRIEKVTSHTELDTLEDQIEQQNNALSSVYNSMVTYPSDEETAGILIEYLETNPHILAIMKSFNLLESLTDDVLFKRAELTDEDLA
jgi:hypothetical protein